jgi:hypothetical protein
MAIPENAEQKIDLYLSKLRRRLAGVNPQIIREIADELRGHILDKIAAAGEVTPAAVDATLARLGDPEALADEYLTDNLLARATASRSPLRILHSLLRWASLSLAGFLVLTASVMGYFLGIVFVLVAVLRPFHPQTAGLWLLPGTAGDPEFSLRLGFGTVPAAGRDLLGWWIIPVGLIGGCGVVTLTTRLAIACAQRYRRSRVPARG